MFKKRVENDKDRSYTKSQLKYSGKTKILKTNELHKKTGVSSCLFSCSIGQLDRNNLLDRPASASLVYLLGMSALEYLHLNS